MDDNYFEDERGITGLVDHTFKRSWWIPENNSLALTRTEHRTPGEKAYDFVPISFQFVTEGGRESRQLVFFRFFLLLLVHRATKKATIL